MYKGVSPFNCNLFSDFQKEKGSKRDRGGEMDEKQLTSADEVIDCDITDSNRTLCIPFAINDFGSEVVNCNGKKLLLFLPLNCLCQTHSNLHVRVCMV